jgi:competence protein ComEA
MFTKILTFIIFLMMIFGTAIGFAADEKKVDLNKATVEELAKVPGLNPELAQKVVDKRKENGEFVDLEELLDIEGIDNNLLRSLREHLFIDPAGGCNC